MALVVIIIFVVIIKMMSGGSSANEDYYNSEKYHRDTAEFDEDLEMMRRNLYRNEEDVDSDDNYDDEWYD